MASSSKYSLRGGRRWATAAMGMSGGADQQADTGMNISGDDDGNGVYNGNDMVMTVASGLKPGVLVLNDEKKRYSGNRIEYIEARNFVLQQWWSDPTRYLTENECVKSAPEDRRKFVREVYRFLLHHGCINLGILKGDPLVPLPDGFLGEQHDGNDKEVDDNGEKIEAASSSPELTDLTLEDKLYELLAEANLEQITEKQLRKQLAEYFAADMTQYKQKIRELVTGYLQEGGLPKSYLDRKVEEQKLKAVAAQTVVEEETKPKKTLGKVIVIGAGPSGLSAGLHLKRNKVDVTVLEARDRVGGRVFSHMAPGFSAPVDLGASIITGTKPELRRALRADPSSLFCTQLGIDLHPVDRENLPLHDARTGKVVNKDLDNKVEKLMNELMDEADDLLDDLPENEAAKASFGQMLDRAVDLNLRGILKRDEDLSSKNYNNSNTSQKDELNEEKTAVAAIVSALTNEVTKEMEAQNSKLKISDNQNHADTQKVTSENQNNNKPAYMDLKLEAEGNGDDIGMIGPSGVQKIPSSSKSIIEEQPGESDININEDHLRLLQWHWAHAEYGCSAPLKAVSAKHWNQDEEYGGFGGPHCMVVGGYDAIFRKMAELLDVRKDTPVASIRYHSDLDSVEVITNSGESFWADSVIVTVPLGVLKAESINFDPPLPEWKHESIKRLGFGALNKIVLEFPSVFWDENVDFFGAVQSELAESNRGWCFMFWNFHRFSGSPILAALVSGEAAHAAEKLDQDSLKDRAVDTLRSIYPDINVPDPVSCTVSRWSSDPYARGSYSYVAVGASGEDYDVLARPILRRILFAGEHTAREHPDTVGGAILSGLREACRALEILIVDRREHIRGATEVSEAVRALTAKKKNKKRSSSADVAVETTAEHQADKSGLTKKAKRHTEQKNGKGVDGYEDLDDEGRSSNWKFDLALGRDVARRQEELRQKEAAREASKTVWRGLMAAEMNGSTSEIYMAMNAARDIHSRQNIAVCLAQANRKAQKAVADDGNCAEILASWLEVSAQDSAQIALVDSLLKAVKSLDFQSSEKNERLFSVIRKHCTIHNDPGIRKLAVSLVRNFDRSNPNLKSLKNNVSKAISRRSVSPNVVSGSDMKIRDRVGSPQKTQTTVAVKLNPETEARLDAAAARVKELKAKLEKVQADAEAKEALISSQTQESSSKVMSFEEYRKKDKVSKAKSEALLGSGQGPNNDKIDSSKNPTATKEESTIYAESRRELDKLVASILKPHFSSRRITKDQYKAILRKASEKVWDRASKPEQKQGHRHWFGRPKAKIQQLVEAYVAAYTSKKR